jgi:hypothetical protein
MSLSPSLFTVFAIHSIYFSVLLSSLSCIFLALLDIENVQLNVAQNMPVEVTLAFI